MIIRVATETDRPAIAAVQAASWRTAYADVLPKDYLDNRLDDDIAAHWRNQDIADGDVVMSPRIRMLSGSSRFGSGRRLT